VVAIPCSHEAIAAGFSAYGVIHITEAIDAAAVDEALRNLISGIPVGIIGLSGDSKRIRAGLFEILEESIDSLGVSLPIPRTVIIVILKSIREARAIRAGFYQWTGFGTFSARWSWI
jgi:hypothetical protein